MNHQEAKDLLQTVLASDELSLIKVEVFRLSWQGKGYNIISDETGYDHDYIRKAGSQLWKSLSDSLGQSVTKRNFRPLLEERLVEASSQRKTVLEYPGAALSFSSPFYIERSAEEARAYAELNNPGCVLRIKGPKKMGKSSLMLRVLDQAETDGYHRVSVDLQQADRNILTDLDLLLKWLCLQISAQLGIKAELDDYWNPLIGSKLSCTNYLQQAILADLDAPVVLVINELNRIFDFEEVSQDFLPLLRSWFEEAKHNQDMQKLRQVLVYSTEVYVQLDLNLSPFNIGLAIELSPFSQEQVAQLGKAYGLNWHADGTLHNPVSILHTAVNGHPYLIQLVLYTLASKEGLIESPREEIENILSMSSKPGGLFHDFLTQLLSDLSANANAMSGFKKLHGDGDQKLLPIESYQLERLGLARIKDGKTLPVNHLASNFLLDAI
ncbi:MAG: hypothetical protein AseanaTS_04610 [Candidatus Pelagadaptatus aseana]|uniref:AAA-like domain-containing protein n=1 Tax=Candidatus Pelagadaptatus aseana TaxID=3120508 RepID=UPI0039B32E16